MAYWFPAKRYGWGWGWPSSWQGWVVLAAFVGLLGLASFLFPPKQSLGAFLVSVLVLAALLFGALASTGAGVSVAWVAQRNRIASASLVVLLLAMFIPAHYMLWDKFPAWYHLVFLASLGLCPLLATMLMSRARWQPA